MNLTVTRGSNRTWVFTVKANPPINWIGASVLFTAKQSIYDPYTEAVITLTGDDMTIDTENDRIIVPFLPEHTSWVTKETRLAFDLQITEANGWVTHIPKEGSGRLSVTLNVSNPL